MLKNIIFEHYHVNFFAKSFSLGIGVYFNEDNTIMTWVFDDQTTAVYNTKDGQGNYLLWYGWPVENFTRCTIELHKQTKDLQQVITDAI